MQIFVRTILSASLSFLSHGAIAAEPEVPPASAFPVTLSAAQIVEAQSNASAYDGKASSVIGLVSSVRKTPNNGTFFVIALNAPVMTLVEVISTVPPTNESHLVVGKELRVLGYLRKSTDIARSLGPEFIGNSPMLLQALCHNVNETTIAVADPRLTRYCTDWAKGYLPQSLK